MQKYGCHENRNKKRIDLTREQKIDFFTDWRYVESFSTQKNELINLTGVYIYLRKKDLNYVQLGKDPSLMF